MTYRGKYQVRNIGKYKGDFRNVCFRSLWERQCFRFCDDNNDIVEWSSESVIVPYICPTDNRPHRYFVDLKIKFSSGKTYLIEIKPKKETLPPKVPKRKTVRFIQEVMTYAKNQAKWKYADAYAKDRGMTFEVWTEETIRGLGIKLL